MLHLGGGNQEGVATTLGDVEEPEAEDGVAEEGRIQITDEQAMRQTHPVAEGLSQTPITKGRKTME